MIMLLYIHRREPYFARYEEMWKRTGMRMDSCNVENILDISDTTATNSVSKYPPLMTIDNMAEGFSKRFTEMEGSAVKIQPLVILEDGKLAYGLKRGADGAALDESLHAYVTRVVKRAYKDAEFPDDDDKGAAFSFFIDKNEMQC